MHKTNSKLYIQDCFYSLTHHTTGSTGPNYDLNEYEDLNHNPAEVINWATATTNVCSKCLNNPPELFASPRSQHYRRWAAAIISADLWEKGDIINSWYIFLFCCIFVSYLPCDISVSAFIKADCLWVECSGDLMFHVETLTNLRFDRQQRNQ